MAFLIAADTIVQAERKRVDLSAWLCSHADEEVAIAAITVAELWRTAERAAGAHRVNRLAFLQKLLEVFEVVPYSEKIAIEHARLAVMLETTGQRVSMLDQILAATALESGATIVTLNTKRFAAIPGLMVVVP
jgi:predicted nucleic acid-binding protein